MNFTEIIKDIDFLVNTDSTSYSLADKTRNCNRHFDDVVSLILQSDAKWKWDDTNQTDQSISTINLTEGVQEYEVSGATYLKINLVKIKNINGRYQVLKPVDKDVNNAQFLTDLEEGQNGLPQYYDKLGDFIWLYPKPSASLVTLVKGLKVWFQRGAVYFVDADTTKVPGFAAQFHRILSVGGALDYAIANTLVQKINMLTPMFNQLKADLITFYSTRSGDEKIRMTLGKENFGVGGSRRHPDRIY